ncbi:P-loop containing nucleoside triphosphate hydrolase protein [Penicillium verhagenii]|uniref:P-loop containing nucleoside triphosphate hydrolase protein n=1 Tax=Penicillium verhagenii TaxID=1562060 RepID=UPI00254527C9|nr:P-loop containing nucleoside triphosphate hydrolase protein [Penicillium verhagenii]KAJ5921139.1 P-loop containing nucleoside triphosphate hydrolase protein [Penicillium verhagenii]
MSPLCEAIIKAFHNYTTQTILYIGSPEKLQGARNHLKKLNISKRDIAILSPQTRNDPTAIWMRNPCGNTDPYLVARHEIDGLRVLSQRLKAEISLEIEVSKNPLHHSVRVMRYLEDSVDNVRFFHAFSQINTEKEDQQGLDGLASPEEIHPMYNKWISGTRLEDLGINVNPEYLDIWEQEPEVRYEKLAAWESDIRSIQTQKLAPLMKDYDLCQLNLDHHNTKNGLEISNIWAKRLVLCDSKNISSCLPELSCIMADTVLVQGADEIDEACILALLPPTAKRLVLIKNEHSWKSNFAEEGKTLALELSPNSLWNRLEAGGFPVTHLPAEEQNQGTPGLLQGTFKAPIPLFNLQERLERSEAWKSLQKMVGLDNVKSRVRLLVQREKFNAQRKSDGQLTVVNSLNGVLMGPPGSGRTTVARLYGQIMADLNLLSPGNCKYLLVRDYYFLLQSDFILICAQTPVIETSGTSLMGKSIEQTEDNIRKAIESAVGNVLIIEDAYYLWGGKRNSDRFYKAAIDTLVGCVSGFGPSNQCVLLVGYEDQLEEMIRHANQRLSRQFPLESAFRLAEYSVVELERILDLQLEEGHISCSTEAKSVATDMIRRAMLSPRFVNARYIQQLLKNAISSCKRRCLSDPQLNPTILVPEDFQRVWNRPLDAEAECRKVFEGFVGCDSILTQLLNDARVAKMSSARGLSMGDFVPFNYIFRGAPGTGKTTIARRMGEILFHMGLSTTSEVIECSFSDLIGHDMGHDGSKVIEVFDRALGKVLFIDDASQHQETGYYWRDPVIDIVEALQSPQFKEKIFVILAGYERNMDRLLSTHFTLRSQFNRIMTFESLTGEQSAQLLAQILNKNSTLDASEIGVPTYETHWELCELFTSLSQKAGWANARDVHTLCDDIVRMVSLGLQSPDQPLKVTIEVVYEALRKMRELRDACDDLPAGMHFTSHVRY